MIWAEFVRDAMPEEMKNAPGAATPAGHMAINIQLHYETNKEESQDDIKRINRTVQRFI